VTRLAPSWRLWHGHMRRSIPTYDAPLSGRSRLDVPQKGAGEPDISLLNRTPAAQAVASHATTELRRVCGQLGDEG